MIIFSCSKDRLTIDGVKEPPAPGFFEKDKTLLGIDSNKNGIRDDVERFINREYETKNLRMGARQYARTAQKLMVDNLKDDDEYDLVMQLINDMSCFVAFYYKIRVGDEREGLYRKVFDSRARKNKKYSAEKQIDGEFLVVPGTFKERSSLCKFKFNKEINH